MKNKFLALFIASLFFLVFSMSGVMADSFAVTTSNISAVHGSSASGSFVINNSNASADMANISCSITIGSWNKSFSCPSIVAKNSTSSVSFSVSVPQYSAGSYPGSISVSGNFSDVYEQHSASFNVNVQESLSFDLAFLNDVSDIYQDEEANLTFRVTNTGNTLINSVNFSIESDLNNGSYKFPASIISLLPSNYTDLTINLTPTSNENVGTANVKLKAMAYNATYNAEKIIEENFGIIYPICDVRKSGHISFYDIINDDDLKSDDFMPLDTIDIKLKIRNSDNEKRYAKIKAVLIYENDKVDDTEVDERARIDASDTLETSIAIKLPAGIEEGVNYLYISVYDEEETSNCEQKVIPIHILKESYDVIAYGVEVSPAKVNCTDEFTLSGKLINVGSNDEEKVKVVYTDDFGNEASKVFNGLDEGKESSFFLFTFDVPKNAEVKTHKLALKVYYDYNDANDEYDEGRAYEYSVIVAGNCIEKESENEFSLMPQITGFIGKNLYASVIVENTGADADFNVGASCNWAKISSVEPSNFSLNADESKNVIINLVPNKGTSEGLHNLEVRITSGDKTEVKTIPVYVYASSGKSWLDSIKDSLKFGTNQTWLWTAIVAGLVIVFIVFIVYFLVRPGMPNFIKMMQVQK